jgi:hypothetical protein
MLKTSSPLQTAGRWPERSLSKRAVAGRATHWLTAEKQAPELPLGVASRSERRSRNSPFVQSAPECAGTVSFAANANVD